MQGDPSDPYARTDFDLDNPIRFEVVGHHVCAWRTSHPYDRDAPPNPTPVPILRVDVDGTPQPPLHRPVRSDDTRESIRLEVEAYVARIYPLRS